MLRYFWMAVFFVVLPGVEEIQAVVGVVRQGLGTSRRPRPSSRRPLRRS
jgi:hypothetical protein